MARAENISAGPAVGHLPALDGLRAAAVVLVMLLHYGKLQCGWIGVNVFFVLSGYLITGILLADGTAPLGQYLKRFYIRRSLRIFPVYYLYLIVAGLVLWVYGQSATFWDELPALASYLYSIKGSFWRTAASEGMLFGHLWSLSIEEQFYILWPFVVYFARRRYLPWVCLGIILLAPVSRYLLIQYFISHGDGLPDAVISAYGFTLGNLDGLAVGSLLACLPFRWGQVAAGRVFGLATLGLVGLAGVSWFVIKSGGDAVQPSSLGFPLASIGAYQYYWAVSAINLWAGALLMHTLRLGASSLWYRLLSWGPIQALGRISYGLYLWHYMVLMLVQKGLSAYLSIDLTGQQTSEKALAIGFFPFYFSLSYGVAWVSYGLIERPFLLLKDRLAPSPRRSNSVVI